MGFLKLGIIVNCMGYDDKVVPLNTMLLENILPELEKMDIQVSLKIPYSDWVKTIITKHTAHLPSQNQEEIKKILESKNNKGLIVKWCIEEFLQEGMECVLHIDGSGKFDLKDIINVINIILDSSVDSVLTKRDKSGMSKFRTLIEEFEIQLVSQKFGNTIIEDGQCGCWCIKLDHNKFQIEKELSARGYEIELDILISQLKYNRNIVWLPIKITDTKQTKFKFGVNISKLEWLSKKLVITKEEILVFLEEFQKHKEKEILEAEEEAIKMEDLDSKFGNYIAEIKKNKSLL